MNQRQQFYRKGIENENTEPSPISLSTQIFPL